MFFSKPLFLWLLQLPFFSAQIQLVLDYYQDRLELNQFQVLSCLKSTSSNASTKKTRKKYAENDARFRSTPMLKELLEKSKLNKEKNSKEIQDKYCIRGAEWGVGDCSAEGMTPDEKDKVIAMLKEKASRLMSRIDIH